MNEFARNINACIILIIAGILIGSIVVEHYTGIAPCPLCMLQKLGMIGFATGELLNLRFGVKTEHYALAYLSALYGASVSISQILLHICPEQEPYPLVVAGLSLYVWAFITFVCALLANSLLLFFYKPQTKSKPPSKIGIFPLIAFSFITLATLATLFNIIYDFHFDHVT